MTDRLSSDPNLLRLATDHVADLAFDRPAADPPLDSAGWMPAVKEATGIHGLGPYLGLRVLAGEIAPPEPMRGWLIGQVDRNRERQRRMRAELLVTLDALHARAFQPVPIKGAALLLGRTDDLTWRPLSDLDLLIPNTDGRTQDLNLALAHAGYCLSGTSWKHRQYVACAPGPPLVTNDGEHPDNPRDVEAHAAVVEMFRGFRWDLTPYITHVTIECGNVRVPSDAAMALHLAAHASIAALEGTARAINLIDLTRALDRSGPLPIYLATRDAGLNTHARFVFPAIALAARETNHPITRELRDLLAPFVPPPMATWVDTVSLYHISWAGRHDRPALDRHALWARTRRERARMLVHTLFPSPAVLASELGGGTGLLSLPMAYARHYRLLLDRINRWT